MGAQPTRGSGNRTNGNLRDEIRGLLELALRRQIAEQENVSRESELAWDSLKHVELMFLLEDHFDLRFSEKEMAAMENAVEIERVVEGKLGGKRAARVCDGRSGVPA